MVRILGVGQDMQASFLAAVRQAGMVTSVRVVYYPDIVAMFSGNKEGYLFPGILLLASFPVALLSSA